MRKGFRQLGCCKLSVQVVHTDNWSGKRQGSRAITCAVAGLRRGRGQHACAQRKRATSGSAPSQRRRNRIGLAKFAIPSHWAVASCSMMVVRAAGCVTIVLHRDTLLAAC